MPTHIGEKWAIKGIWPRTTGAGYKGMLHQPDPHNSPDLFKGLVSIRKLHLRALLETGFSCADSQFPVPAVPD